MGDDWDFLDSLDFGTDDAPDLSPLGYDEGEGNDELIDAPLKPTAYRRRLKQKAKTFKNVEELKAIMKEPPAIGEEIHFIVKDTFSMWTLAPVLIDLLGNVDSLYGATWRLSLQALNEFKGMLDAGRFRRAYWLLDKYFEKLEPSIVYQLKEKLATTGKGWVKIRRSHIKVLLLESPPNYLVGLGSVNMATKVKLIENLQLLNDKEIFNFYRSFFEEV